MYAVRMRRPAGRYLSISGEDGQQVGEPQHSLLIPCGLQLCLQEPLMEQDVVACGVHILQDQCWGVTGVHVPALRIQNTNYSQLYSVTVTI